MKRSVFEIKKVKPIYNRLIISSEVYTDEDCTSETGMIESNSVGMLKNIQTVIAIGDTVRCCNVGDTIMVDFTPYEVRKYSKDSTKSDMSDEIMNEVMSYKIPTFVVDNTQVLMINDNNIQVVIETYDKHLEEVTKGKKLV